MSTWIEISAFWDDEQPAERALFMVSFDLRPRGTAVRLDDAEVIRVGHEFFRAMLMAFVREGGIVHVQTSEAFDAIYHWPQVAADESELTRVLDALLTPRDASPYPVVMWFEPKAPLRTVEITEERLRVAARDFELLHEVLAAGLPRLFLDADFADLLADPADRHWIRSWIEQAADSTGTPARFEF